jgi:hypothetical protein
MSKKKRWYQIVRAPEDYVADTSLVKRALYVDSDLMVTRSELSKLRRRFQKYATKDGTIIDDFGFLHDVPNLKIIKVTVEDVE